MKWLIALGVVSAVAAVVYWLTREDEGLSDNWLEQRRLADMRNTFEGPVWAWDKLREQVRH